MAGTEGGGRSSDRDQQSAAGIAILPTYRFIEARELTMTLKSFTSPQKLTRRARAQHKRRRQGTESDEGLAEAGNHVSGTFEDRSAPPASQEPHWAPAHEESPGANRVAHEPAGYKPAGDAHKKKNQPRTLAAEPHEPKAMGGGVPVKARMRGGMMEGGRGVGGFTSFLPRLAEHDATDAKHALEEPNKRPDAQLLTLHQLAKDLDAGREGEHKIRAPMLMWCGRAQKRPGGPFAWAQLALADDISNTTTERFNLYKKKKWTGPMRGLQ